MRVCAVLFRLTMLTMSSARCCDAARFRLVCVARQLFHSQQSARGESGILSPTATLEVTQPLLVGMQTVKCTREAASLHLDERESRRCFVLTFPADLWQGCSHQSKELDRLISQLQSAEEVRALVMALRSC